MNIAIFILFFIFVSLFFGALFEAPWLPTRKKDYHRIAELTELRPDTLFYDLGSGTGGMLFYLSRKYDANCIGIEISPVLYFYSKIKSLFYKKVNIKYGDFLKYDLSKADIIYAFLLPENFEKLKKKIDTEAKNGAKLILSCWPLKDDNSIRISKKEGEISYYVYITQKEGLRTKRSP